MAEIHIAHFSVWSVSVNRTINAPEIVKDKYSISRPKRLTIAAPSSCRPAGWACRAGGSR